MYSRKQLFLHSSDQSLFFWGARQTGKSTLLKAQFPQALLFDLLKSDVYRRFSERPEEIRELVLAKKDVDLIIIDEVQKVPALLDEVHWLIENTESRFILSGSSPRKILRSGVNLLGGRALRYELYPLSYSEVPDFDLLKALNHGLLPRHYDAEDARLMLDAYIGSYLEDEIVAETKIRNIEGFSRFLRQAAFSNGEIVNYSNIAAESGVSSPSVKDYFQILEETMLGRFVQAYRKRPKRRVVQAPKFYLFDIGVANQLLNRRQIDWPSTDFGHAFEHFIYHELSTYAEYSTKRYEIKYWRTSSGFEVDFVLAQHEVAIEVKSTDRVIPRHAKGLRAFLDEYTVDRKIIVSQDPEPRLLGDGIEIVPWRHFLDQLWAGEII